MAMAEASPFQLEEALFSSAPVGLHCINSSGVILWANEMELGLLGFTREQYFGQRVESFVYMDLEKVDSSTFLNANGAAQANAAAASQQPPVSFVNDRTLYKEVLHQITSGRAVHNIPIRFVTFSGSVLHLLLDCDAQPILHPNASSVEERYYRCFTRDDTARRIQEMRSNVLFQETNRSLQMLDNFMNRSMTQMRLPLTLMERACNLVAENIEDIDELISANLPNNIMSNSTIPPPVASVHAPTAMFSSLKLTQQQGNERKRPSVSMRPLGANIPINLKQTATNTPLSFGNINTNNFSAPLAVALSATSEARSVVGLASRIVDDALTLVDDITDLCRFDQGQALVVDKEAVKVREVCIEALTRVPIPLGSRGVEVLLDIQAGTPGRAMADRGVLQRILALLMNFAVDAAANAVSKATQSQVTGKVILSLSDAAFYQAQASGSASSCKISVFYSNPPDGENVSTPSLDVASMYKDHSASFSHCEEDDNNMFASGVGRGGSMTRRTRLRENIERGMTTYQREKLGLGLSLVHHLVSAHGSDLRYEIVADETMSKFWFLLPLSLDFPERLNAERMLKDDMLQTASRPIKKPKVAESMESMAVSTSPILPLTAAPQFPPELSATQAYTPAIRAQAAAMPEAEEAESTTFTVKQPRQYPGVAPGARPLVLVVEDTDVSASLLCMHLRKLNCTSHRAENGEVALEMLRSAPDPRMYSLVLMDLRMPVMDGFEAAEIIRGSIASNIPIVALTGETNEEHKRKCEEIGFDAFETKPLKRPQLKELLQNLVPGYEPPSSPS